MGDAQPRLTPRRDQTAAREAHENQARVRLAHGLGYRLCQGRITLRHSIQRPVRLDMLEFLPVPGGEGGQRPDLVSHQITRLGGRHGQHAPPEAGQIGQAGVRAQGDAALNAEGHGAGHRAGVARMEPAGDIRRRDGLEQGVIITQGVYTVAFPQVGIQVNAVQGRSPQSAAP